MICLGNVLGAAEQLGVVVLRGRLVAVGLEVLLAQLLEVGGLDELLGEDGRLEELGEVLLLVVLGGVEEDGGGLVLVLVVFDEDLADEVFPAHLDLVGEEVVVEELLEFLLLVHAEGALAGGEHLVGGVRVLLEALERLGDLRLREANVDLLVDAGEEVLVDFRVGDLEGGEVLLLGQRVQRVARLALEHEDRLLPRLQQLVRRVLLDRVVPLQLAHVFQGVLVLHVRVERGLVARVLLLLPREDLVAGDHQLVPALRALHVELLGQFFLEVEERGVLAVGDARRPRVDVDVDVELAGDGLKLEQLVEVVADVEVVVEVVDLLEDVGLGLEVEERQERLDLLGEEERALDLADLGHVEHHVGEVDDEAEEGVAHEALAFLRVARALPQRVVAAELVQEGEVQLLEVLEDLCRRLLQNDLDLEDGEEGGVLLDDDLLVLVGDVELDVVLEVGEDEVLQLDVLHLHDDVGQHDHGVPQDEDELLPVEDEHLAELVVDLEEVGDRVELAALAGGGREGNALDGGLLVLGEGADLLAGRVEVGVEFGDAAAEEGDLVYEDVGLGAPG